MMEADAKKPNLKILFFILVIGLCILGIFFQLERKKVAQVFSQDKVTLKPVGSPNQSDQVSKATYDTYKGDIITSTKDGTKRINLKGKIIWDQPFTMNTPQIKVTEPYVLVADFGGTEFYVFNNKGLMYSQKTNYPILNIELSESGQVVILEENRDAHTLTVYNTKGEPYFKRNTSIDNGGYPIDMALDQSGDKLVVNYLDITNKEPISNLVFFNLTDQSIYEIDQIVNAVAVDNEFIGQLDYIAGSDGFIAYGDQNIRGYSFKKQGKEVFTIPLSNKIADVATGDDYFVVAYGEPLLGFDEDLSNQVMVYNESGRAITTFTTKEELTSLSLSKDQIIMGSGREFVAANVGGSVIWKYNATADVKNIKYINKTNVMVLWEHYYQIFKKYRLY